MTEVITPPGRFNLPRWHELWEAREVAYRFGQRDVVLRYRQTAIGVAWVLLQPLASAGIFSIVFGSVAKLPSDGVPYFLFSFVSMLAWTLFSGLVSRASNSVVSNQTLVSKVFFPRMLVPLSTVFSVLLDFAVALALGIVLLLIYGVNPGWPILLVPIWTLLVLAFGMGVGLAASALMVKYRDVAYVLPWLLQIGLYATPVAYSLSAVPGRYHWLFLANPMSWLLECFRWSMLGTPVPPAWQIGGSVAAGLGALVFGVLVFQSRERVFADLI
ncbi:ABC transporter permease [Raineyella fluvialis]|uniref:Transport permease protein n=1 Tax=Raineyella fluvialis TaxID=2662261 RepID=A0A5Q2FDM7_9ACTN|nr:ABC transporter permease [Raineyella fluvialis]QGF23887.1 ABC transporter permease [Raineyella fluvialis]